MDIEYHEVKVSILQFSNFTTFCRNAKRYVGILSLLFQVMVTFRSKPITTFDSS